MIVGKTIKRSQVTGIRRAYHRVLWLERASGKARLATPGYGETTSKTIKGCVAAVSQLRAVHCSGAIHFPPLPRAVKTLGDELPPKARLLRGGRAHMMLKACTNALGSSRMMNSSSCVFSPYS